MLETARQYIPYRSPSPAPSTSVLRSVSPIPGLGAAVDTDTNTTPSTTLASNAGVATIGEDISHFGGKVQGGGDVDFGSPGGRAHPGTVWKGEVGW